MANLLGTGSGPRSNGDFFLKVGSGATVFDDDAPDSIRGGNGDDWFFANLQGGTLDQIKKVQKGENVQEL